MCIFSYMSPHVDLMAHLLMYLNIWKKIIGPKKDKINDHTYRLLGGSLIILKSLQLVSFTDIFVQLLSALRTVFLPLEKQNSLIYCQKADDFFASTARWRCCCCCCFPCFPGKDQIRRHCLSIVDPVTTKYHDYFYFFKFDVPYNWYHA